jgi:hypothetical protein
VRGLLKRDTDLRSQGRLVGTARIGFAGLAPGGQAVHGASPLAIPQKRGTYLLTGLCGDYGVRNGTLFTPVENTVDRIIAGRKGRPRLDLRLPVMGGSRSPWALVFDPYEGSQTDVKTCNRLHRAELRVRP